MEPREWLLVIAVYLLCGLKFASEFEGRREDWDPFVYVFAMVVWAPALVYIIVCGLEDER